MKAHVRADAVRTCPRWTASGSRYRQAQLATEGWNAQHVAQLAAEQAKTEKAIEAFSALAQRLEATAAQRAVKPWWQRLPRRADETSQPRGPTGGG
jgi:hypothetical protein